MLQQPPDNNIQISDNISSVKAKRILDTGCWILDTGYWMLVEDPVFSGTTCNS